MSNVRVTVGLLSEYIQTINVKYALRFRLHRNDKRRVALADNDNNRLSMFVEPFVLLAMLDGFVLGWNTQTKVFLLTAEAARVEALKNTEGE